MIYWEELLQESGVALGDWAFDGRTFRHWTGLEVADIYFSSARHHKELRILLSTIAVHVATLPDEETRQRKRWFLSYRGKDLMCYANWHDFFGSSQPYAEFTRHQDGLITCGIKAQPKPTGLLKWNKAGSLLPDWNKNEGGFLREEEK